MSTRRWRTIVTTLAVTLVLVVPVPAFAWWGWLEKLSGPKGLHGPQFDVRVVCFGDVPEGATLSKEATALTGQALGSDVDSTEWKRASATARAAAKAWATYLGKADFSLPPVPQPTAVMVGDKPVTKPADFEADATMVRVTVDGLAAEAAPELMSTSSAGVEWSLCRPDKARRFSLDAGWGYWFSGGGEGYDASDPIKLNTVMGSISWRVFSNTDWDILQASAGAGLYWFSSEGFPANRGMVVQPGRLTVRAPSTWSRKSAKGWKRLLALPVYGVGVTIFPSGFEASDFAGSGPAAVRIPSEVVFTHYFFVNWQPLLYAFSK